jgi:hypothetical protein
MLNRAGKILPYVEHRRIGIDVDVHEGGHGHEKGNVTGGTLCFVVVQFGVGVDNGSDGR